MNPVHEHCSSQNLFEKKNFNINKNQIKSNQIRQNFRKNKIFKNEIFVDKNVLNV